MDKVLNPGNGNGKTFNPEIESSSLSLIITLLYKLPI